MLIDLPPYRGDLKLNSFLIKINSSTKKALQNNSHTRTIESCKPRLFRFFMEQHIERLLEQQKDRTKRADQVRTFLHFFALISSASNMWTYKYYEYFSCEKRWTKQSWLKARKTCSWTIYCRRRVDTCDWKGRKWTRSFEFAILLRNFNCWYKEKN